MPSLGRGGTRTRQGVVRDQNAPVKITKLTGTDAFVVVDLDGADRAAGVVRWAKKILQDGAVNLARHLTYGYAALGIEALGASAGINAEPEKRAHAIEAFVSEAGAAGARLDAGKGVTADELAGLPDDRSPLLREHHDGLLAAGFLGALRAARGDLSGLSVAIEGSPAGADAVTTVLTAAGATVTAVDAGAIDAPCDVLCVGSKVGAIDHHNVERVEARTIAPLTPLPITARGLAHATRAEITVLPDFVTLAGPLVAHWPAAGATADSLLADAGDRVAAAIAGVVDHAEGPLLGACEAAEAFLLTWQTELPFGRPIA